MERRRSLPLKGAVFFAQENPASSIPRIMHTGSATVELYSIYTGINRIRLCTIYY